jgi:hypothetical protein
MIARIVMFMFIVTLAIPIGAFTPSGEIGDAPWSQSAAAAKGKKHKKKDKKPTFTTVTRTVRQPVTRTFTSTGPITIPNGAPGATQGNADRYPAAINVNGFANGVITDVNLTLHALSHTAPVDLDILLVPGQLPGQDAIVMSDVGNDHDVSGITLKLDDQAAAPLSVNDPLTSGTFKPNNFAGSADTFPGQTPSGNSLLGLFNGGNPNGSWQLFIVDDHSSDTGQLAGGWSLQITAEADVQVQERVPVSKDKKHKKGKKRKR